MKNLMLRIYRSILTYETHRSRSSNDLTSNANALSFIYDHVPRGRVPGIKMDDTDDNGMNHYMENDDEEGWD